MFIAHIGLGLAAKRIAPTVPLGVLLLASEATDVLCGVLMFAGIEKMRASPGATAMTPLEFLYYPWSHGLFMNVVWGLLAAFVGARLLRDRRGGVIIGLLVFSHWALDFISHKPDMPLLWDNSLKVGLGLWNSVPGSMAVEFALFIAGIVLYSRMAPAKDRTGTLAFAGMAVFFAGLFLLNHFAPPPPATIPPRILALPILIFIVLLPWGNWIDRHRGQPKEFQR
jgi:hypothetical protein